MPIRDLATHQPKYVTVPDLARYWAVSRQQIYKRIEVGDLEAIRLSARLYRVRTAAALQFEQRVNIVASGPTAVPRRAPSADKTTRLPTAIGVQRVSDQSES